MHVDDCFYLGRIIKKHGYAGELVIRLDTDEPERYYKMESVLVLNEGILVPFFFQKIETKPSGDLRILFEGLTSDQSLVLVGKELYLPLELLPALEGNKFYYHEVKGFEVIDSQKGNIGVIKGVLEHSVQALLQIIQGDKEILLPIVDNFIRKVDRQEKCVHVEIPEGLLEIYLDDNPTAI